MTERHRPLSFIELTWDILAQNPGERVRLIARGASQVWWLLGILPFLYFAASSSTTSFEKWGLGSTSATLTAVGLTGINAATLVAVLAGVLRGNYSRMRPPDALLWVAAGPPTLGVAALLNTSDGVPLGAALAVSLALSYAAVRYIRSSLDKIPTPLNVAVWLDDPTRAADLVRDCEQRLLDDTLKRDDRAEVEANLASGLAVLSFHSGHGDPLPRAYEILARSINEIGSTQAYVGASRLAEAMSAKAVRTGDGEGHEESLQLMLDAAEALGQLFPSVLPRARLIHATHLAEIGRRADRAGQHGRAARLRRDAVDDLLVAIGRSSPRRTVRALAELTFASMVDRSSRDLDEAIALARSARRRLRLRSPAYRDFGRLVLCDLLAERATHDPRRAERDLGEATRLCKALYRRAASRPEAVRRLPALLRRTGAAPAVVDSAYREAFGELSSILSHAAADLAAEWSSWAAASATPTEAAEAHWLWIRAVADDARRTTLRADKERRLREFLDLAEQTGERLLAAGRSRDAAVAFDLGRAMLLTERIDRDREGIVERLVAAGATELAERWCTARDRVAQADRAGFARLRPGPPTMLVGGRRFQQHFTTGDHLALADREQLLREISLITGLEDVDAPASYDDLRAAASEGPVVYLSTSEVKTSVVVVTAAAEPVVISLRLTRADVIPRAHRLRDATTAAEVSAALRGLPDWLWDNLIGPVAECVEPGSLVTLIPLGALSLLPLHAAGIGPDEHDVLHDPTEDLVFRYAPNARVLGRAQAQARAVGGRPMRLLTAGVRAAPGEVTLDYAEAESQGVEARFGPGRTERPPEPTRAAVLSAMDDCGIWHFACHAIHRPLDPLESSLALSDGRLKLRTIFERPAEVRRLAILSGCRTATPGESLPDEVVSFPSALLEAGVAGVVCSQSVVNDREAMLLVLCLFDELAKGAPPARALANAQRWLCRATNAEIHAAFGNLHPMRSGYSTDQRDAWLGRRSFADPRSWASFCYCGA